MANNDKINSLETRKLKCIEGILFSFKMAENIYLKLFNTCQQITEDKEQVYEAMQLSWSFIDAVHRIREILQSFPSLNKKDIKLLKFLSNTKITEIYRNYIQHLRQELTKPIFDSSPVWGSLSWVDEINPTKCYLIIVGSKIDEKINFFCVFDKEKNNWISKVCLSLYSYSYNFDLIFEELRDFMIYFTNWLEERNLILSNIIIDPFLLTLNITQNEKKQSKYEKTIVIEKI